MSEIEKLLTALVNMIDEEARQIGDQADEEHHATGHAHPV